MMNYTLKNVVAPGQYVGGEVNQIIKPAAQYRFALAFPDVYTVGMSNHGLRILYEIINTRPAWQAERVFVPFPDREAMLRQNQQLLTTLETATRLKNCDLLGVSLACELHATGMLTLLDLGGIPLFAAERPEKLPLILAGGNVTFNPAPLAEFVDAFVIGDGEEVIVEIMAAVENFSPSLTRAEKIQRLAEIDGVYAPRFSPPDKKIKRRLVADLSRTPTALKPLVPLIETAHERIILEIMRGCPNGCRFCQAGLINRPVRYRPATQLLEQAKQIYQCTGYDEISLLSLSSSDYPELEKLAEILDGEFAARGVNLSLPSLRVNDKLLSLPERFKSVRKSGLTFAPEAGSERLRAVINKDVTDENLLSACATAFASGWRHLKLYFMIGLPTETDADILAIANLVNHAATLCRTRGRGAPITCSVSNFIPKPATPFQWYGMNSAAELTRKQQLLGEKIHRKLVDYKTHDVAISLLEGALARGDARLGKVIFRAWQNGARLDNWSEYFKPETWQTAFAEAGLTVEQIATANLALDEKLAWDNLDLGVSREFLRREYERARAAQPTPQCSAQFCAGCGLEAFCR